jgi:hypothetical protein
MITYPRRVLKGLIV